VRMRVKEMIEERLGAYQKPGMPDNLDQTLEEIITDK